MNRTIFSNEELRNFDDLLYTYNSEIRNRPKGFKMNKGETKLFIDNNGINLTTADKIKKHNERNTFIFTESRNNKGASFIAHIRNAYAHSHICIDGDYYLIKDYKEEKKGNQKKMIMTAYGRIHKDLLFPLIDKMLYDRKQRELQ